MRFGPWVTAALLAAGAGFGAPAAFALVSIPQGTTYGTATDLLTLSGTYATPLPVPAAQPFAVSAFSLSLTLPAQVTVDAGGPVLSAFFVDGLGGSYTDDGDTETFSDAIAVFGATNTNLSTFPDNFSLDITDLLVPADSFVLSFQASGALFNPTTFQQGVAETITIATGSFAVSSGAGSATYAATPDPGSPFGGTLAIAGASTPVPEPSSPGLLLAAVAGLWLFCRYPRTRARNPAR
jgi:hypothetical protein